MVNLRISTAYYPPYFDMDERGQPTGSYSYLQFLKIVSKSGINATYVYASKIGDFKNGTYDGMMGLVYNNLADTALAYYFMDAFPPPGKYGPVLNTIDILDIFSKCINISILVSLLLVAFTLIKHHAHHSIIAVISQISKQNFSHLTPLSNLPHLAILLWLLFIHALHGGLYTTNSFVVQPPERVETLRDIISLNKTPIWWNISPVKKYFEMGVTKDVEAVWSKAKLIGLSKCVLDNSDLLPLLSDLKKGKSMSMILAKNTRLGVLPFACQSSEEEVVNGSLRFQYSKPILSVLIAAVLHPNLTRKQVSPLKTMFSNIFEFGMLKYLQRGSMKALHQSVSQSDCSRKLLKGEAEDEPMATNLELDHVLRAIVLYFLAIMAIGSLLMLEHFMSLRRTDGTLIIKVTTIIEIMEDNAQNAGG